MAGHINTANNQQWNTPQYLVDLIMKFYKGNLDLDPCSNENSLLKADSSFSLPEKDGLEQDWTHFKNIFINPNFQRVYIRKSNNELTDPKVFKELIQTRQAKREDFKIYTITDWLNKTIGLFFSSVTNNNVLMLIPAAVSTKPWQKLIFPWWENNSVSICFINGRIQFQGAEGPCPMGMSLVYFGYSYKEEFAYTFQKLGVVI